jgi:hypothetical protein
MTNFRLYLVVFYKCYAFSKRECHSYDGAFKCILFSFGVVVLRFCMFMYIVDLLFLSADIAGTRSGSESHGKSVTRVSARKPRYKVTCRGLTTRQRQYAV